MSGKLESLRFSKSSHDLDLHNEDDPALILHANSIALTVCITTLFLVGGNSLHFVLAKSQNSESAYSKYSHVRIISHSWNLEFLDKAIWILTLSIGFWTLQASRRTTRAIKKTSALIPKLYAPSTLIMCVSIIAVTPLNKSLLDILWFGFGAKVFLASIMSIPIAYLLYESKFSDRSKVITLVLLTPVFFYTYVPVLLQPIWAIKDHVNSGYVLNEVLAQSNGQFPAANFAAQYTSFYGSILDFTMDVFKVSDPHLRLRSAAIFLSFLSCTTFVLMVIIGFKIVPQRMRFLAAFLILPIALVTVNNGNSGVITVLFSAVPVRTFSVFLVALILIRLSFSIKWIVFLGVVASLSAVNNIDFGFAALIALVIVLQCHPQFGELRLRNNVYLILGILLGFASFVCYSIVSYGDFHFNYFVLFARSFSSGFGSEPMPVYGPHVLLMSVFIGSIAIGSAKLRGEYSQLLVNERRAAVMSLYFGLTAIGAFPYFVNRSVISGQLQIFLLLAAPPLISWFSLVKVKFGLPLSLKSASLVGLSLIPQSLLIGTLAQAPDGRSEWRRVSNISNDPYALGLQRIKDARDIAKNVLGEEIGLGAVAFGNIYLSQIGIDNISLISNPSDARVISGEVRQQFCDYLQYMANENNQKVLVEDFVDLNGSDPLCKNFHVVVDLGDRFTVVKLN